MPVNFDEIMFFFLIYGQFSAIPKPDSGRMVYKTSFSFTIAFNFTKTENKTKKTVTQLPYCCFVKRYYFCQKKLIFYKKKADINKINRNK